MLEAEENVLGCLLLHDGAIHNVGSLRQDDFMSERHGIIFRAVSGLSNAGHPHDLISVTEHLRSHNMLQRVGGASYLSSLIEGFTTLSVLPNHVQLIKCKARDKRLAEQCELYLTAIKSGSNAEAATGLHKSVERIMDETDNSGWVSIGDAAKEAFDGAVEASKQKTGTSGLSTGLASLDDALAGGMSAPDLIVIGGRPGMGKTALAMTLAAASGGNVGFFSLEMQNRQLASRYLAGVSGVNTAAMRTGRIKDYQWSALNKAVGKAHECKIWIDDTPGMNIVDMKARAVRLQAKQGLDLLIVDYLQLATAGIRGNRVQDVSEVSRKLKEIAKILDVPVIALAQLNRQLEQRPDKRPVLSDLRESGQLEQDADIILFLYREWVYNKQAEPGHTEAIIAKHRNGLPQTVNVEFVPEQTVFRDW